MTRRLVLRASIALLLFVGTSVSYGAAMQTVAELRAQSCCTHDCGHDPAKAADPSRCCGVAPAHAAVAPAASVTAAPAPSLVTVAVSIPASPSVPPCLAACADNLAAARAAPVFLLTRSLRI